MPSLCRICLRSGFVRKKEDIDDRLTEFHDELCDYDVFVNCTFTFCAICEYQLRKFYNFKQKCRRAHKILKSKRAEIRKKGVEDLHKLMPPESIGLWTPQDRQGIYYYVPTSITLQNQSEEHVLVDCNNEPTTEPVLLTSETVALAETNKQTPKNEKPIDLDSIKIEFSETAEEETLIFIQDTKSDDDNVDKLDLKQELENPEEVSELKDVDVNEYGNDFNVQMLEDFINSDDEDEKPLSKSIKNKKATKKKVDKPDALSLKELLEEFSDSDIDEKKDIKPKNKKKKDPLKNMSILVEEISMEDLKLISKALCKSDRKIINMKKGIIQLKEHVLSLIDQGKLDLGENVTLTKEDFLDKFAKCDKSLLYKRGVIKKGRGYAEKLKKFLLFLVKKYNPEYETIFDIEYLTTQDMKLAEFKARKDSKEYLTAKFKCDKCYKAFELQSLLDYHNKWHDERRPHGCDICEMRFTERKHLNAHVRSSHYSVYKCKLCDVNTYIHDVMVNHYNQHKGVRYTCDVCLGEYSSKSCLNTHRLTHATHTCSYCPRSFVSESGLYIHVKHKHQDETPSESPSSPQRVSCDKCDMKFKSRDALYRHTKIIHSGLNNLFRCRFAGCRQHFSSAAELRQHSAASGHERQCPPDNGRRRQWSCEKIRHRINVTGPGIPYRTCPICKEQVPNKFRTALYKHHLAAHPAEPYKGADELVSLCEYCGKAFVHRSIYRDHLNTHTGVRPYSCRECGARFHMRRALYVHRDHHGPPRHQCKDCGKMFRTTANLFTHRRTHIGDRRFKCEICFKGFLHAGSLKEHINGVHHQIRRIKKTK